ncbi:MAG: hypothetical protein JHC33_12670 [Ignisphaera sp.]|nr:hypothetical protein [Ignisphaera sp.]
MKRLTLGCNIRPIFTPTPTTSTTSTSTTCPPYTTTTTTTTILYNYIVLKCNTSEYYILTYDGSELLPQGLIVSSESNECWQIIQRTNDVGSMAIVTQFGMDDCTVCIDSFTTTTTTTTLPNIPCNTTYSSGGSGVTEYNIPLDPLGGVILFQFSARNVADKIEIIHDNIKKSTSGMLSDGNSGPFDAYGEPPTNLPTVLQTYDINQFIGKTNYNVDPPIFYKNIQPIPTRQLELLAETGIDLTLTGSYEQFVWWVYTPSDYTINNNVIIRITGPAGGTTGWDLQRLCPSPTTTTTTTICQRPEGLTNGNLISSCHNSGDPEWIFYNVSVEDACNAFNYYRDNPETAGTGVNYWDMQYDTLNIDTLVYRYNNGTDCTLINNGYYWFQPNISDITTYFKTINQISIVTIVAGYITAIDICNYIPTTTTTTTI